MELRYYRVMPPRSLYTIPARIPFVDALAGWLLEKYAAEDPAQLASALVLLPSRRACQSLREAFLRITGGKPLLLPRMQPIGDVDDEELLLMGAAYSPEIAQEVAQMPPVISPLRRQALLTRLVHQFRRKALPHTTETYRLGFDQSADLAAELARLMDHVAREELSFAQLRALVPEGDLASHWQEILRFLEIITHQWPEILKEENSEEPVARRNRLLHLLCAHWQASPPAFPVIAAGSTGSQPATAALLKVIAGMERGAVILPGLDLQMEQECWEAMEESHPQYGMKLLLERMQAVREEVDVLGDSPPNRLLEEALRPAGTLDQWQRAEVSQWDAARLRLAECEGVHEEAMVIALAMRQALETEGKRAALITQDRALARYAGAMLRRFGIAVDDSAGKPLSLTAESVFLRLILAALDPVNAVHAVLALLKHPFAAPGMSVAHSREAARLLEVKLLRKIECPKTLFDMLEKIKSEQELREVPELLELVVALEQAFAPFMVLQGSLPASQWIEAHLATAEALSIQAGRSLWQEEAHARFFQDLQLAVRDFPPLAISEYAALLEQWMDAVAVRPAYGMHPRLHILSPIEARLQHYDLVILGGLNEGSWPQETQADPWMSRPMRGQFGLPLPERMVGQSAHDFYVLASSPEVLMTRSLKSGGSPATASRWLLRLRALVEGKGMRLGHAQALLEWARQIDQPEAVQPVDPPAPKPDVALRPRKLSVTRVETLLRDPYGIYARYILRLKKLDEIDQEIGHREFGELVHQALEKFFEKCGAKASREMLEELLNVGKEVFKPLLHQPSVARYWWPRFERIAAWVLEQQAAREAISAMYCEINGEWKFEAPRGTFTLEARADRVERYADGSLGIVDYKTGTAPGNKDVEAGFASQIVFEALIAEQGAYENVRGEVSTLEYWKLSGGREPGVIRKVPGEKAKLGLEALKRKAMDGLMALIAAYDDPQTPYYASPHPDDEVTYNDYEYLERIGEWR